MTCTSCTGATTNEAYLGPSSMYNNLGMYPTVDRPKPLYRPSTVLVTDGGCDPQFSQWQCIPYAFNQCEKLYSSTGFAEDYLQCLDDRFSACRDATGCNYRFNLTAEDCAANGEKSLSSLVKEACQAPGQEFPSWDAYQACVDRVTRYANDGCSNISSDRFGPVTNFGPAPTSFQQ